MRKIKLYLLVLSLFSIFFFKAFNSDAQDFKLQIKNAEIVNDNIIVEFDFTKFNKNHKFIIWLEIKNSSGEKLNVISVTGDAGINIPGGKNKQITWNFIDDKIIIEEEISIEVKAELIIDPEQEISKEFERVSGGKAFFLSLVFPGWGLARTTNNKKYYILGGVSYATAITASLYSMSVTANYEEYLAGDETSTESQYYQQSIRHKKIMNVFQYTALSIWASSILWTLIKSIHVRRVNLTARINPYLNTKELVLSFKF